MRNSTFRLLAVSGVAVLAASAHDVASAEGVGGTCDGGWIAYSVSLAGHVSSVDGSAFRIDEVALALPGESDRLPVNHLRTSDLMNYDQYEFAQGDFVSVHGSLRADGSVLALWFEPSHMNNGSAATPLPTAGGGLVMSDYFAKDRYRAGAGRFTSGVVASVESEEVDGVARPVSFVVDGVTYRIDPDQTGLHDFYFKAEQHVLNEDGSPVVFQRIAAGDAVLVDWTVEEADGSRDATRISIRQAGVGEDGVGAVLCGTITAVWSVDDARYFPERRPYNFAVDGVPVAANDYLFRTDYEADEDPYAQGAVTHYVDGRYWDRDIPYAFSGVRVGMHVRVDGTLRDGRVFADRVILVIENAESVRAKRAAKRAGRLRARGVLTVGDDGTMRLSGLPVELPRRASRAMTKRAALAASRPVRVDARVRGGELVATRIARR